MVLRRWLVLTCIAGCVLAPLAAGAASPCCDGDCNGDSVVKINEVIAMIDVVLGSEPVSVCENGSCPCGSPDPGLICEVTQPIRAVTNALNGCPR